MITKHEYIKSVEIHEEAETAIVLLNAMGREALRTNLYEVKKIDGHVYITWYCQTYGCQYIQLSSRTTEMEKIFQYCLSNPEDCIDSIEERFENNGDTQEAA